MPTADDSIQRQIDELDARVEELEKEVKAFRFPQEDVIVLRTVPRKQAKKEILSLFHERDTLYYSDIVRKLNLDLALVVELCQELIEEEAIYVNPEGQSTATDASERP
jgi:hypothetical protein